MTDWKFISLAVYRPDQRSQSNVAPGSRVRCAVPQEPSRGGKPKVNRMAILRYMRTRPTLKSRELDLSDIDPRPAYQD